MKIFLSLSAVATIALPATATVPVEPDLNCYMLGGQGEVINLQSLCSSAAPERIIRTGDVPGVLTRREPANSRSSSGGSSGGGNCDTPDDRAADGSRCGGRAASVRAGGR